MAGVLPKHEIPYRKLSAGGVPGFHAPYLSVSEGKYSKEEIESVAAASDPKGNPRSLVSFARVVEH
jgi:hypothetical protein